VIDQVPKAENVQQNGKRHIQKNKLATNI